jgi:hypothetical protein
MPTSYIFQPHVHELEAVVTPDVLIDELCVASVATGRLEIAPLPVDRLTMDNGFQVTAEDTTADAAIALIGAGAGMLIGIASDHRGALAGSDRLACAKPICREVWRFADVADHAERLIVRSGAVTRDRTVALQGSALADWPSIPDVIAAVAGGPALPPGHAVLYTGLPRADAKGAVIFDIALEDPVCGREIAHRYTLRRLAPPRTVGRRGPLAMDGHTTGE